MSGIFITLEGPECAGKSTQLRLLADFLRQDGWDVLCTREPGGTRLAEDIRAMLLEKREEDIAAETELLLFAASRAQHVRQVIMPHLKKGGAVICDRFIDSTTAYQGYARGLSIDFINKLNAYCVCGRNPDVTLLFDLPVEETWRRLALRSEGKGGDRMESQGNAFHTAVRNGFLDIAKRNPERVSVLDAMGTIEEIAQKARKIVENCSSFRKQQCH